MGLKRIPELPPDAVPVGVSETPDGRVLEEYRSSKIVAGRDTGAPMRAFLRVLADGQTTVYEVLPERS
jgi:hypothetical protein